MHRAADQTDVGPPFCGSAALTPAARVAVRVPRAGLASSAAAASSALSHGKVPPSLLSLAKQKQSRILSSFLYHVVSQAFIPLS